MGGNHELKFGFGYRKADASAATCRAQPGARQLILDLRHLPRALPPGTVARATADRLRLGLPGRHVHARPPDPQRWACASTGRRRSTAPPRRARNVAHPRTTCPASHYPRQPGTSMCSTTCRRGSASPSRSTSDARPSCAHRIARYAGQLSIRRHRASETRSAASAMELRRGTTPTATAVQSERARTSTGVFNFDARQPEHHAVDRQPIDPDFNSNRDHEFVAGIERELCPEPRGSSAYT